MTKKLFEKFQERYPDYSKNGTSLKAFINKFQNIIKTIIGKKDPHS